MDRCRDYDSNPLTSEECLELLSQEKDISGLLKKFSTATKTNQEQGINPNHQCVIVPVLSMCQEINLFDLSSEILSKVIKCAFASIFNQLDDKLFSEVYSKYETFFTYQPGITLSRFSSLFEKHVHQLYQVYQSSAKKPKKFYEMLTSFDKLQKSNEWEAIIAHLTKKRFLKELSTQFTSSEFATCQRFLRMEIDLVILLTRLIELATNTQGGISGITEALNRLSSEPAARYFEDDDFKTLFLATEEVAKIIIKLAKLYQKRFAIFKEINRELICSRPQPPVQAPIVRIPLIPPTVIT